MGQSVFIESETRDLCDEVTEVSNRGVTKDVVLESVDDYRFTQHR